MTIVLLEPALAELDEAVEYYESQAVGLGASFLEEFSRSVQLIHAHPLAWHPLGENTRRCRLTRFPYGVVYAVTDEEIIVVAIAHLHRRPKYWLSRMTDENP